MMLMKINNIKIKIKVTKMRVEDANNEDYDSK
jgi:hypothetical protein